MLLGERLGRRHQRALIAVLDRAQQRVQRDDGLARPDLAHQQPLHRARLREVAVELRERPLLVAGQRERQHRLEPAGGQLALAVEHRRGGVLAPAPAAAQQRQLHQQQLVEREPAPALLLVCVARREVCRRERAAAVGQALAGSQPRGQRLDHVGEPAGVAAHQREDLGRGQALGRGVVRDGAGAGRVVRRSRVGLDPEPGPRLELAMQHQPRSGRVLLHQPRLVEERRLHRAGVVGDGRLDQRPHAPPADRARGDAPDLDDHRRLLAGDQLRHRARLATVAGQMLEQIADGLQPERLRRLLGLVAVELERQLAVATAAGSGPAGPELVGVKRARGGEGGRSHRSPP